MKIKRFFAEDIRQALRQVREVLGPDAVILSNKSVEGGIELVAAMDYDESEFSSPQEVPSSPSAAPSTIPLHREQERPQAVRSIDSPAQNGRRPAARIEWSQDPVLVEMRKEMKALRRMMENELSGLTWRDMSVRDPQVQELYRRLIGLGLSPDVCGRLVEQVGSFEVADQAWKKVLHSLAGEVATVDENLLERGGVVALIGPTGVGKTTTAAKLAARFALRHGNRHVALVSADSYRIGAKEQLNTYARILDVPVRSAATTEELISVLNTLADKRLIMIDTAGMSQRDIELSKQLSLLDVGGKQIRSFLTLSAATEQAALEQAIKAFGVARPEGCILTKVDEAASLGGALSALIHSSMPLAFTTDGQKVPEDIHLARPNTLVSIAAAYGDSLGMAMSDEYLALTMGGERVDAHG
ncbi:MAG: flagellar biosynthesis protein FlhF [Candidatus Sedimenticola sp. (ex Thyasira tokunagai)]